MVAARSALLTLLLAVGAGPTEVDFATLAGFEYVEGEELPAEVTELDGETVVVSGFMRSEDGSSGPVEFFMLINDACGCNGTPKLNEIVFCAMPEGETADLAAGTVEVEGRLHVEEIEEDGVVVALYTLDVDRVRG
jgi:hypothetical protein